jgi:hypothetical protein
MKAHIALQQYWAALNVAAANYIIALVKNGALARSDSFCIFVKLNFYRIAFGVKV